MALSPRFRGEAASRHRYRRRRPGRLGRAKILAGDNRALAEWQRGTRSDDNRVLIQILGVDADYREYGKSGNASEIVIKDLPSGSTVKVQIIALNGSLEAPDGPEAQITLP